MKPHVRLHVMHVAGGQRLAWFASVGYARGFTLPAAPWDTWQPTARQALADRFVSIWVRQPLTIVK